MLIQNIRHTVRAWRRTPVLALTAILTLSFGVGANAAVFSVVHAVLFRPLPYPAPERLVEVFEESPTAPGGTFRVSALNYLSWAERAESFEALAAFRGADFNVTGEADAERVAGASVTASLSPVLGLTPVAGRPLRAEDEMPGSARVALLSHSFWQRRYGRDPSVIGKTITLNGERHEIVGVVPESFREVGRSQISAVADPQIFVPLAIDPAQENRGNHVLRVAGRLRPGVPIEQAREEMNAIAAALEREFPASNKGWGALVERVHDSMLDEGVRTSLLTLLGAVAAVMVIACANVSNLLLARAIGRQRELALRTALGAEPGRLVRQSLIESLCLAVVSGIVGVFVSIATVQALRPVLPPTLPRIDEVRVDFVVLAFGLVVALGSGILLGILPAMRVARVDPLIALMQGGRGVAAGSTRSVVRQGLVAAQMALATTLLVAAALLLQSFVRLQNVPLGFASERVLTARVGLPRTAYPDAARWSVFYQRLVQSLESSPEVEAAAVGTSAPFTPGVRRGVAAGDGTAPLAESSPTAVEHVVSDAYFRTLSIPIVAGRAFDERDRIGSPSVVIVNRTMARQLWPESSPLGRQLQKDGRLHEVVGVVGDVRGADGRGARGGGLDRQPAAAIYLPATQFPQTNMTVLLRTRREPSAVVPALREAIRDIDPTLPIYQVRAFDDWLGDTVAHPRLTTTLAGAFAVAALLLAAIGIYGIVAYSVGQRTAEIGLRMAVGATRSQILALILRGGMTSTVTGIAVGSIGALFVSEILATLLFEVRPDDSLTFVSIATLLFGVALLACYVPARRAARVDPLVALRCE
jgi:putative ABC transport system permease protein